jgi:flagellar motor switch protein FliN/FliY
MVSSDDKNTDAKNGAVAVEEDQAVEARKPDPEVAGTPEEGVGAGDEAVKKAEFQQVGESSASGEPGSMDILLDVVLPVAVELGSTARTVKEILSIGRGSVIELDRAAGEPVDILVSGKLLGKGEVVVLNDRFGVRLTELANPIEGIVKS